jgi:hypothetical protein
MSGAFGSDLIIQIIRKEYFQSHEQMAVNDNSGAIFNPIPYETIALVATAVRRLFVFLAQT